MAVRGAGKSWRFLKGFADSSELSRRELIENPKNKKEIICDHKLKMLFSGKDTVNMLQISGLLSPHFVKVAGRS